MTFWLVSVDVLCTDCRDGEASLWCLTPRNALATSVPLWTHRGTDQLSSEAP